YLTIEYRGTQEDIPEELRRKMGNKIFGCDDCLDICPFNVHAQSTKEKGFHPFPLVRQLNLDQLLEMRKEAFEAKTHESPLRRPKYEGFQRNIRIAWDNRKKQSSSTSAQ
ncbi:MAG: hypothetical protein KC563_06555, partial [Nitrospira sp.]|nr:hypothetical protein [Nitrospira sp.]